MSRDSEAADWFARMRAKDADASRAAFDAWMRDPANAAAYADYESDWKLSGALSPAPRARSRAERRSARFAPGGTRWALATAATIALAALVAWQFSGPRDKAQIASGPMLPGELRLADGSKVRMMDGAWVEPQFTDRERRLRLHGGRARFEVAHDSRRPFIVIAGNSETKALGTIFEVDTREAAPRIVLIRGAVEVRLAGTTKAIRLAPGETAEVGETGPHRLPAMTAPVETTMIDADRLPLGAVVERANRANTVPIRLADPSLAALEITGRFDVGDSAALARKLAAALGLVAEFRGGEIVLAKAGIKNGVS